MVDRLKRRDIVAPQAGFVLDLQAHTVGGVIAASEPIMDIVPGDDDLVTTAQVQPLDIDKIQVGSEARIRLSAFNQRTTPEIFGRVKTVSGDRLVDAVSGLAYYLALIELPADVTEQLNSLSPGPWHGRHPWHQGRSRYRPVLGGPTNSIMPPSFSAATSRRAVFSDTPQRRRRSPARTSFPAASASRYQR